MTKYIEELNPGDSFTHLEEKYLLSYNFKKNGDRSAINLRNGQSQWFISNQIIDVIQLYYLDKDNNIIAIKEVKKDVNISI